MNTKPYVSVVIPSLNVCEYIKESMHSILNQSLYDIEILCIDAGSTDGTVQLLTEFAEQDPRVLLYHSNRKSYGYQVNFGIAISHGEYIAIVEPDDYVDCQMYQVLYEIARRYNLDYIKADFDSFFELENGERVFCRVNQWPEDDDRYDSIIEPTYDESIYIRDYSVWRGIYKQSFLVSNEIWFNETDGAAYQDIGFKELVVANAKRAMYINQSFYRYRTDRIDSSVNSVNGMEYSYQEFSRLLENDEYYKRIVYKKGLFCHLVHTLFVEYNRVLKRVDFNYQNKKLDKYIWFFNKIEYAKECGYISNEIIEGLIGERGLLLLSDPEKFASFCKNENSEMEHFLASIYGKKIVIFGGGRFGQRVYRCLKREEQFVEAIVDNNREMVGKRVCDILISSPNSFYDREDVIFVIAMKKFGPEVRKQLIDNGVKSGSIYFAKLY